MEDVVGDDDIDVAEVVMLVVGVDCIVFVMTELGTSVEGGTVEGGIRVGVTI